MASPPGAPLDALAFCHRILPLVSRTFALNIRLLPPTLKAEVGAGYLICRILDTVEDAPDRDASFKSPLLKSFTAFLENKSLSSRPWFEKALAAEMTPGERDLLLGGQQVLDVFHHFSETTRSVMIPPIRRMAEGMAATADRTPPGGRLHLETTEDLLGYCYFVAGTVGELLTGLFENHLGFRSNREALRQNAVAFGNGLQLVNILKDIAGDSGRGVCYIPGDALAREGLTLESFWAWQRPDANRRILNGLKALAARELTAALEYTRALPVLPVGLRRFCAVPLMLAMETLALLGAEWNQPMGRLKIDRAVVRRVLLTTPWACLNEKFLSIWFNRLMARVEGA